MREGIRPKSEVEPFPAPRTFSSRAEWEAACWRRLLSSPELLQLLTTAHERHVLTLRAAALSLLRAGKSYRQIGDELWVSPQTISGIAKVFEGKGYQSYMARSKIKKEREKNHRADSHSMFRHRGMSRRTKYGIVRIP